MSLTPELIAIATEAARISGFSKVAQSSATHLEFTNAKYSLKFLIKAGRWNVMVWLTGNEQAQRHPMKTTTLVGKSAVSLAEMIDSRLLIPYAKFEEIAYADSEAMRLKAATFNGTVTHLRLHGFNVSLDHFGNKKRKATARKASDKGSISLVIAEDGTIPSVQATLNPTLTSLSTLTKLSELFA